MDEKEASFEAFLKTHECEGLLDSMLENNITIDDLSTMSHQEWCDLLPEVELRAKMATRFPNAEVSSADTESNSSSEIESSLNRTQSSLNDSVSLFSPPPAKKSKNSFRYFKEEMSLQRLLQKHHLTEKILLHYTNNEDTELTDEQRHMLVGVITDGLLLRHDKVSQEMINDVSHEICELFVKEVPTTYFQYGRRRSESVSIHGNTSKNPKGKLYEKIQN